MYSKKEMLKKLKIHFAIQILFFVSILAGASAQHVDSTLLNSKNDSVYTIMAENSLATSNHFKEFALPIILIAIASVVTLFLYNARSK